MNSRDTQNLTNKFKSEAELDIGVGLVRASDTVTSYNQLVELLEDSLHFSQRKPLKSIREKTDLDNCR
jgi:hypothetical protein